MEWNISTCIEQHSHIQIHTCTAIWNVDHDGQRSCQDLLQDHQLLLTSSWSACIRSSPAQTCSWLLVVAQDSISQHEFRIKTHNFSPPCERVNVVVFFQFPRLRDIFEVVEVCKRSEVRSIGSLGVENQHLNETIQGHIHCRVITGNCTIIKTYCKSLHLLQQIYVTSMGLWCTSYMKESMCTW